MLRGWLETCEQNHPGCMPEKSLELNTIRLIDLKLRKLITFPTDVPQVNFAALSYVWGDVHKKSFQVDQLLPQLPQTLEDAMVATQELGLQYLWVDYVCIDQHDNSSKQEQIEIMGNIYGGAYVTLVVPHGKSAAEGIPRVGEFAAIVHHAHVSIGRGNEIVSRLPSLRTEMGSSPHAQRAWTYQEILLSRRKLIFTKHQVHLSCRKMMQCESIFENGRFDDEEASGGFSIDNAATKILDGTSENSEWRGIYDKMVAEYVVRKMSYESDALNAISGILSRLQRTIYLKGFAYGLPRDEFRKRLCWIQQSDRFEYDEQSLKRRSGFPSWSWLGWVWEMESSPSWWYEHDDKTDYCPYCCLIQPPLIMRFGPDDEVDCANDGICETTRTVFTGGEAVRRIRFLQYLYQTGRMKDNTKKSQFDGFTEICETMVHVFAFLRSLHRIDRMPGDNTQRQVDGLTEISGVIVQISVVLRQLVGKRYDFTDGFQVLPHVYDRLGLKDCEARARAPRLRAYFDGPIRDLVSQEDVCVEVDCLLVAWRVGVKDQADECPLFDDSDTDMAEIAEWLRKMDTAAKESFRRVELSLLLLKWRNGVAYRAGFVTLTLDADGLFRNLEHLNPVLTRFVIG
ncbi:hypothetical protein G647_07323 [Cladophialophora carrionii CBS 160.54]|uniref:Heterokaryon incompatibility domain-containing protein n=1 Tax=Cladophialophora carrionii CBS 160.54 TaxID=1279043 RepID=V9D280_9EURO|nr:uncharacterized protein G647_07323 [Cladophialophora carrionii CBS 160.54]ETI20980.1 hypothetical protein G647_07323 [Cladophialophora carrionii CBS 160.54]